MTTDVELLPLPKWMESFVIPGDAHGDQTLSDRMTDYALANVLRHTAPLRYALDNAARDIKTLREVRDAHAAEIVALRAEREVICAEAVKYADKSGRLEAKVDRLAEAGRRVTAAFRAHGEASSFTRQAERTRHECEAAMLSLADALRDHEQEAENHSADGVGTARIHTCSCQCADMEANLPVVE